MTNPPLGVAGTLRSIFKGLYMKDELGNRMKDNYERRSQYKLTRRIPVILRIDGRAFHTYTRGCESSFDIDIMDAMCWATRALFEDAQGAQLAYVQSDEISLFLSDYQTLEAQAWFDYKIDKLCSNSASIVTANFNAHMSQCDKIATFDARCANYPKEEVANYFVWRAKDWRRNSISMYARSLFSHKELNGLTCTQILYKLEDKGYVWNELDSKKKYGTFLTKEDMIFDVKPTYEAINGLLEGQI